MLLSSVTEPRATTFSSNQEEVFDFDSCSISHGISPIQFVEMTEPTTANVSLIIEPMQMDEVVVLEDTLAYFFSCDIPRPTSPCEHQQHNILLDPIDAKTLDTLFD
jgi:hypothetical protein